MAKRPLNRRLTSLHQDVLAGTVLIVFSGLAFLLTMSFREVPAMLSQNVPPTFFPRLVLGIIALLSLALIGRGLGRAREVKTKVRPTVFLTAGLISLSVALLQTLGMMLTTFLLAVVLPICWGERRFLRIAIVSLGLPVCVHLVFSVALGVRFPGGSILTWLW